LIDQDFLSRIIAYQPETNPAYRTLIDLRSPISQKWLSVINGSFKESAVMVTIRMVDNQPNLILTKRSEQLRNHAGQICFPGGILEPRDLSLIACALREANEEVNLKADQCDVIAKLDSFVTGTGYKITPIVCKVSDDFIPTINKEEVAECFEVPFTFFKDKKNLTERVITRKDTQFRIFEYRYKGHYIWGATASIIQNLVEIDLH
jgi:8-oxo-dGTP pyrophosphatase MutT (NUDIX family)